MKLLLHSLFEKDTVSKYDGPFFSSPVEGFLQELLRENSLLISRGRFQFTVPGGLELTYNYYDFDIVPLLEESVTEGMEAVNVGDY